LGASEPADQVQDAIEAVMRAAGSLTGSNVTAGVVHDHGFLKICTGRLIIDNATIRFESKEHMRGLRAERRGWLSA
jgi:hypothetical protein